MAKIPCVFSVVVLFSLLCGCNSAAISTPEAVQKLTDSSQPAEAPEGWFKSFDVDQDTLCADAIQLEDGNFLMLGTTILTYEPYMGGDIKLVQTDEWGTIQWEKTFDEDGEQEGITISLATDGGYLISGTTYSIDTVGLDVFLMKVNIEGEKEWITIFPGSMDELGSAKLLPDGSFIVMGNSINTEFFIADPGAAGYNGLAGRSSMYVAKYDEEGQEIWLHNYGGELNVISTSKVETANGGGILLGSILYYPESGDDIWLLNVDKKGEEIWSKYWREGGLIAYDVIETTDGNYLLSGAAFPAEDAKPDLLFIKFDADGNELWQTRIETTDIIDSGSLLTETSDGSFVASGGYSENLETWDGDVHLTKIDKNGKLLWQKVFDTNTHCMFADLIQRIDGGYTIIGTAYIDQHFKMFMIFTDEEGGLVSN